MAKKPEYLKVLRALMLLDAHDVLFSGVKQPAFTVVRTGAFNRLMEAAYRTIDQLPEPQRDWCYGRKNRAK